MYIHNFLNYKLSWIYIFNKVKFYVFLNDNIDLISYSKVEYFILAEKLDT